jgi:predicted dehydrogenase
VSGWPSPAATPRAPRRTGDPEVGALILATPHDLHLPGVELAARHGKPVLVEKPLARTLPEADRLLETARRAGILLMVAENAAFMPAFAAATRLVAEGAVGPVSQVVGSARGFRRPHGWRLSRDAVGGGLLIDGGIHYIRLIRQWGQGVTGIAALAPPPAFPGLEAEDSAVLIGRLGTGGVFSLALSHAAPRLPRPQWIWITGRDGSLGVESAGRAVWLRGARRSRVRVFLRDRRGLGPQMAEFVAAVREGRPPRPGSLEARADLAVVLAAYRSIVTGAMVAVEG